MYLVFSVLVAFMNVINNGQLLLHARFYSVLLVTMDTLNTTDVTHMPMSN